MYRLDSSAFSADQNAVCMAAHGKLRDYVTSLQRLLDDGLEDAKMWLDVGGHALNESMDSRQGPPLAAEAGCAFCASSLGRSRLQ